MYTKGTFAGKLITASYLRLGSGSKLRRQVWKSRVGMDAGNTQLKCEMMIIFQKTAMMVCSLFKAHYWLHYTQEEKKKYCLRKSEWKKKKFDKGRAIFHYQHNTELKVVRLGKSSPVHTIQQMFQEKFHLAICVSYFFPFFWLPNWLYRIKCKGIIKSLCNYLLNIQREFHRSCFSSKTKRKFYKLY